ncbi:LysR substrate-binding domain-containing protein [Aeromonas dhakensis]
MGPRSVVQTVIGPLLEEYCRRYPDVQPDIRLDDRVGNWVEERVDVGLRIGISPQEGLIARRLFPMQLIICAAPAYLRKYGVPSPCTILPCIAAVPFATRATGA